MLLSALCAAIDWQIAPAKDRPISAIRTDSRFVEPGDLFIAYSGVNQDAHDYIAAAIARGAAAVVCERAVPALSSVPHVIVSDARRAWALLSAAWFGNPSRRLRVVGITGTDGKTTTASLTTSILREANAKVGMITTVAANIEGRDLDTGFHTTTPEPPELQAYLATMVAAGIDTAIVETTSHALALEKVAGVDFDLVAITNVTAEHLDFHRTFSEYLESKARLFDRLTVPQSKNGAARVAVLNRDDASFARLSDAAADRRLSYGRDPRADVRVESETFDRLGAEIDLSTPLGRISARSRLVGPFNVSNTMAAVAIAIGIGVDPGAIRRGIESFQGVPGRFQRIDRGQPFMVVVDFAHTANSLEQTLILSRTLTAGRLTVVFGCAGERDHAKRPAMGAAASRHADLVIVTAEDPRSERIEDISADILRGVVAAGGSARTIPDRLTAIRTAIGEADRGDVVLITGKGHEQSMNFGGIEVAWSDEVAVLSELSSLGYR